MMKDIDKRDSCAPSATSAFDYITIDDVKKCYLGGLTNNEAVMRFTFDIKDDFSCRIGITGKDGYFEFKLSKYELEEFFRDLEFIMNFNDIKIENEYYNFNDKSYVKITMGKDDTWNKIMIWNDNTCFNFDRFYIVKMIDFIRDYIEITNKYVEKYKDVKTLFDMYL